METNTTTTIRKAPTAAAFRRKAEAMFRRANPEAGPDLTIRWCRTGPLCSTHDGRGQARTGAFVAEAPGYRARRVFASYVDGAWSVR